MKINLGAIARTVVTIAAPIVAEKAADAIRRKADKLTQPKER